MNTLSEIIHNAELIDLVEIERLVRMRRVILNSCPPDGLTLIEVSSKSGIWNCHESVYCEQKLVWKWKGELFTVSYSSFGGKHTHTLVLNMQRDDTKWSFSSGDYCNESKLDGFLAFLEEIFVEEMNEETMNIGYALDRIGIDPTFTNALLESDTFINNVF